MLLICGEIDLSVGQVFALAPFIMYFANHAGVPLGLAIAGGADRARRWSGWSTAASPCKLRVPSFVTTLGTLFMLNGLTLTISRGFPVDTPGRPVFADHGAASAMPRSSGRSPSSR